jgi:hypothetical protein
MRSSLGGRDDDLPRDISRADMPSFVLLQKRDDCFANVGVLLFVEHHRVGDDCLRIR